MGLGKGLGPGGRGAEHDVIGREGRVGSGAGGGAQHLDGLGDGVVDLGALFLGAVGLLHGRTGTEAFQGFGDLLKYERGLEGFEHVVLDAQVSPLFDGVAIAQSGAEHDRDGLKTGIIAHAAEDFDAAHLGHHDIQNTEVGRRILLEDGPSGFAVTGGLHLIRRITRKDPE